MKIVIAVNKEEIVPFRLNVELKKVGSKVTLLNIADDITHYLVHNSKQFSQLKFEPVVEKLLWRYGNVCTPDDQTKILSNRSTSLDFLVLSAAQTIGMQELLYTSDNCVVIHNESSQLAKIWLFSH